MRQQQVWFHCDGEGCDEASVPETRWPEASKTARKAGWQINNPYGEEPTHFCPVHH